MTAVQIAGRELGPRAFVIAEIGNNHDGSIRQAERLIAAAAEADADAVKFQTHIAEAEMLPSTPCRIRSSSSGPVPSRSTGP